MGAKGDLLGQRFGRLVVMEESGRAKNKAVIWRCLCDCGEEITAATADLKRGNTTSCGCYRKERVKDACVTHELSRHPLYRVWASMMGRCFGNGKHTVAYGDRGITVCASWLFVERFVEDMTPFYKNGLEIDRIDNNGNYCPENCRWVTRSDNQRNKRNNRLLTYKGETKTITEWSERLGVRYAALHDRLKRGWTVEQTFETPTGAKKLSDTASLTVE